MPALTLSPRDAADLLTATHGIEADVPLAPLGSELASTFRAESGGRRYAVKMQASDRDECEVQRWRADVADHLHARGHPVPRLLPVLPDREAAGGSVALVEHGGRLVAVTVSEWVDAVPYGELGGALTASEATEATEATDGIIGFGRALGALAARMQADLATAPRPPRPIAHAWAAHTTAATIAEHLTRVSDAGIRDVARLALELHERTIPPIEARLPRALVHQDLHDSNVLARPDGTIAAVIDFDDMLLGWRIAEPAIAAAYLSRHAPDPVEAVAAVAEGWESELPFTEAERFAFPAVVLARLALNASVWNVRMAEDRAGYARMRQTGSEEAFRALARVLAA